jgi:hypothetical protein
LRIEEALTILYSTYYTRLREEDYDGLCEWERLGWAVFVAWGLDGGGSRGRWCGALRLLDGV